MRPTIETIKFMHWDELGTYMDEVTRRRWSVDTEELFMGRVTDSPAYIGFDSDELGQEFMAEFTGIEHILLYHQGY